MPGIWLEREDNIGREGCCRMLQPPSRYRGFENWFEEFDELKGVSTSKAKFCRSAKASPYVMTGDGFSGCT